MRATRATIEFTDSEARQMWVIYLEAFGVLAVVMLLVWWTMRGKR
jgi:hypothetical protein